MNAFGFFVLFCAIGLPVGWFISEFKSKRPVRIGLGIVSILLSFAVAWLVGTLQRLNYNAWYGAAAKDLVDAVVAKIELGDTDKVLAALKEFQSAYSPTYENRASFDKLAEDAAKRMK